jgi:hypothetical protein
MAKSEFPRILVTGLFFSMLSALLAGKCFFEPLFLVSSQLWHFAETGIGRGHNVGGNSGQLRWENLGHKVLLKFERFTGAFPPAGEDYTPSPSQV